LTTLILYDIILINKNNILKEEKFDNVIKPIVNLQKRIRNKKYKVRNNYEKQLENYIVVNLQLIEDDMKLIKVQYSVNDGIIDILARDKNNKLCIIELVRVWFFNVFNKLNYVELFVFNDITLDNNGLINGININKYGDINEINQIWIILWR